MSNVIALSIVSILAGAAPSVSFRPPVPVASSRPPSAASPSPSALKLNPIDLLPDGEFVAGSFFWGLNFYYGFDWILAPLGTGIDSDFSPAYRTATFVGSVLAGKSPGEAYEISSPMAVEGGERPEMGSRVGSGANVGYATEAIEDDSGTDWLSDREAGLRSPAPFPLRIVVAASYVLVGAAAMAVFDSVQTAAVLTIPALVYEIGRPSLPTREEAVLDAALDKAVTAFADERVVSYGQEASSLPEGVRPVGRDEATNERELVVAFRAEMVRRRSALVKEGAELSDFQIEMRFRELGTGRSEAGYIKGIRLLREKSSSASAPWG